MRIPGQGWKIIMIRMVSLLMSSALLLLSGCTVHQSIGDSFGSYVSEPDGQSFKPVGYRWDYEHTALLYVYRPASQWAMDELESPSFNVNGERLFNIKGGGYTWYEMKPGAYDLVIRRGILGFEGVNSFVIRQVARLELDVSAGKVYYLRYSEIDPPAVNPDGDTFPQGDGPLQLVAPALALAELPETRMIHHGRGLLQPVPSAEEEAMQSVFSGEVPQEPEDGLKARPKTKDEDWWPF